MIFPPDSLAEFKSRIPSQVKHSLGAASLEPFSLQELLALADEEQLQEWNSLELAYASDQGDEELRNLISDQHPGLSAKNVVTFCGAQEAIFVAYHALLSANDSVLCVDPIFPPLRLVPQGIGASVQSINLKEVANEWTLDMGEVAHFLKALKGSNKLFTINFPHNPTGAQLKNSEYKLIVDEVRKNNTWLLSDEVFRGLESSPVLQLPSAASVYEKGISVGVLAKAYALGGVRVGWLACQDEAFIQSVLSIKSYLSMCCGKVDELLSKIALRNSSSILQRNIDIINFNTKIFDDFQQRQSEHVHWIPPKVGYMAFPRFDCEDSEVVIQQLMSNSLTSLIPGKYFSDICGQHFRLGLGLKSFQKDLDALESGLGKILVG